MKKSKTTHVDREAIIASLFDKFAALNGGTSQSRAPNQLGDRLRRDAARFQHRQPDAAHWNDISARVVSESGFFIIMPS